jgi:Rps23 Pro-64 3,4-dihydroxylase Tpa1-like proline 4-hydroxylase
MRRNSALSRASKRRQRGISRIKPICRHGFDNNQENKMSVLNIDRKRNSFFIPPAEARKIGEELSPRYQNAEPYAHIQLEDFFPEAILDNVLLNFPQDGSDGMMRYDKGYVGGKAKLQFSPTHLSSAYVKELFYFFNSEAFVEFLEGLTGIEGLIPDPFFEGAGLHQISTGGKLGIHADFRIQRRLSLQRRVNVLIYLNKKWDPQWGGELELWNRKMTRKMKSIQPLFNRCVIFNTDADSFHGHPEALNTPQDVTRKSIALYYYTASKAIFDEVQDNSTDYRPRPGDGMSIIREKILQNVKNGMRQIAPPILFNMFSALRLRK